MARWAGTTGGESGREPAGQLCTGSTSMGPPAWPLGALHAILMPLLLPSCLPPSCCLPDGSGEGQRPPLEVQAEDRPFWGLVANTDCVPGMSTQGMWQDA